jgi:hypothetical protein
MPLSASDYTTFLKYQSSVPSLRNGMPPRPIQSVNPVAPNVAIMNAYIQTSEASFRTNPRASALTNITSVRPPPPNQVNTQRTTQLYVARTTNPVPSVAVLPSRTACTTCVVR